MPYWTHPFQIILHAVPHQSAFLPAAGPREERAFFTPTLTSALINCISSNTDKDEKMKR